MTASLIGQARSVELDLLRRNSIVLSFLADSWFDFSVGCGMAVDLTKREVAQRQLLTAVRLLFSHGDLVSVVTLASRTTSLAFCTSTSSSCHRCQTRRRDAIEFEEEILKPFDSHLFWGSWKWIGWFGTEFTWIGRWIMHSVVRRDTRAVKLCIDWLKDGTYSAEQSSALRYGLSKLTGIAFENDAECLK